MQSQKKSGNNSDHQGVDEVQESRQSLDTDNSDCTYQFENGDFLDVSKKSHNLIHKTPLPPGISGVIFNKEGKQSLEKKSVKRKKSL